MQSMHVPEYSVNDSTSKGSQNIDENGIAKVHVMGYLQFMDTE